MEASTMVAHRRAAPKPDRLLGVRHLQVALITTAFVITFSLTFILSIAIVAMVDGKNANPDFPEYKWSGETQRLILSAFTWGLVPLQIPAGWMGDRLGPVGLIGATVFATSIFAILTPVAASGGWGLVFACRFMQGLGIGMFRPAFQTHLARWVPVEERGFLYTLPFAGGQVGYMLALGLGGVMCTSAGGWPSVFYWFGGLGVGWTVLWMLVGSNCPAVDRFISVEERAYIEDSLRTNVKGTKPQSTPWRAMLTSWPVWAVIVANCGRTWGFWTLNTEAPTFIKHILGFSLQDNGLLAALPHFWSLLLCLALSRLSDVLNKSETISLSFSRRLFNTIGLWVPAVALVILSYATDKVLSIVCLNVAISMNVAIFVGFKINPVDLAPNYSGTINGISNTIASFLACFAPLVDGAIVTDNGSVSQWQVVFFIAAGVYFVTGMFFVVFGKATLQWWNDPPVTESTPLLLAKQQLVY